VDTSSKAAVTVLAKANHYEIENVYDSGYSCLTQNPARMDMLCTSTQMIDDADQGIHCWKVSPDEWTEGESRVEGTNKR